MANFDPAICSSSSMAYELAPSASELESYMALEIKPKYPHSLASCASMMRTPVEKYEPGMNMALHPMPDSLFHGMYSEPSSSLPPQQYSFPLQHMRHSPPSVSTGSYLLPSADFDTFSAWSGEPEDLHGDFYPRQAASMVPAEPLDVPMPSRSPLSSGSLTSNGRKRRIKQAQHKTKNLREAQIKHSEHPEVEVYEDENWSDVESRVRIEGKAQFMCEWFDCIKSFRRLEHLKRHHDT